MKTLESISNSIRSKRNSEMDSLEFPFADLVLSEYDIREDRDIKPLIKNLKRDGQLQPITISLNKGVATIVNGRTRFMAIEYIRTTEDVFNVVKVEVYVDLSETEQDYLNAQINISQSPLTPNEKTRFVDKYKNILNHSALCDALGVKEAQMSNYIEVSTYPEKVRAAFSPKSTGHERSDIKVEEVGKISKAYKSVNNGLAASNEIMIQLGTQTESLNMTRDVKRKIIQIIAKKTATFKNNINISNKYSDADIVDMAIKESRLNNIKGGSGDKLPINSVEKYKIIDSLLKDHYDFAVILFSEGLTRETKDGIINSETKRIIDSVNEIIIIGNELEKMTEVEVYAEEHGKKVTVRCGDAIDECVLLSQDDRNGFVYVNGASLFAQRPEFINYLKKKFPNSTVSVIILDLMFGKSMVHAPGRNKEIVTIYGGAESFDEILIEYKRRVKFLKLRKFADYPQQKYIAYC